MSEATFAVGNFSGGEISKFAQGRFDKPDYRNSLKVCLNSFPVEISSWARRPGTRHAGTSRGGSRARGIKFDFDQSAPITLEFTDGFMRFRNGATLIAGNDPQVVVAVSAANPAVVQTTSATTWVTGNTLIFPGASTPLLENRQFIVTKVNTTHFSLADALTGTAINGASLGALVAGATVARVQELVTVYGSSTWSGLRAVQAETTDILLAGNIPPQALNVPTLPSPGINPVFAIAPAIFNDGPYLDPFTNGAQATPSAKTGIISLTLAFPAYSATTAYAVGAFVTSVGINYISLVDQNVNNTPAISPTFWATTSAGAAINDGRGFLGTDIGRLVRLFSEPPLWAIGTAYVAGNIVSYNPSGIPGATTYWQALAGSTGKQPGSDLTNWQLVPQGAAIWSWGKITSLSSTISGTLAGSANIGDMTLDGGLASAFDGVISKNVSASAVEQSATPATLLDSYIGKNYSGASAQAIASVTVYPSIDEAISVTSAAPFLSVTLFLRAKATVPSGPTDGTLLGQSILFTNDPALPHTLEQLSSAVSITSNDQTTTWNYVWVEIFANTSGAPPFPPNTITNAVAQVVFFSPTGTGVSTGINLEILGPALLYTNPILTWRLGVYSNTTGFPTCGTYNDGRLYLGGAVANRFDACVSNGMVKGTINFAPTDQYGVVAASSAISYTFNSDGVNPILWMDPDLQGIKMGTQAGEWLVAAPTAGSIAPNNISARNVTNHGSANIQPCRTEHTTIFVQRFAQKLLEYFPDVYSGKFSAPNLADKAQHITRAGVAELAYTSAVTPVLWGRDALGALFGITYKRDSLASAQPPTFYGWHRHALGSGRVVESVCAGPSTGGNLDSLTMVTNDAVTNVRHFEVMTDTPDELSPLTSAWFLDNAVNPTSISASATGLTINGLWHLNGKTVQVFAGGLDCGDLGDVMPPWQQNKAYVTGNHVTVSSGAWYTALTNNTNVNPLTDNGAIWQPWGTDFLVTNGSVFVPFGDSISAGAGRGLFTAAFAAALPLSQIVVGFIYNSDGQMVKPILPGDSGARNGPALGKLTRAHRYAMLVVNTLGLSVGGAFTKLRPAKYETPPAPLTMFTGIAQDGANDDDGYDNGFCWRVSRPFPANVTAVALNLNTKDQ